MKTTDEVLFHEPENIYHARSKSGEVMSSHMLQLFAKSPYKYWQTITGEYAQPESDSFAFGRAAHKLILEGADAFFEAYTVSDGPMNPKTGQPYGKTTKAYQEWAAKLTTDVVSQQEYDEMFAMMLSLQKHDGAYELLTSEGEAELVCRACLENMECQIRMDYFSCEVGIVDLKTCRDIDYFEKDCRDYGYVNQLAFYRDVLRVATGISFPVNIITVDKTEFHVAGRWTITEAALDEASEQNRATLRRCKKAFERDEWPTGYELTRQISRRN